MIVADPTRARDLNHFAPRFAVILRAFHEDVSLLTRIPADKEKENFPTWQSQEIRMLDVILPNIFLQDESVRPGAASIR